MNQADIETFLMLEKTRNITKTAENLFLSQPTVSHKLRMLEEELQVSLIERKKGHKKIELTQKGEEFLPIAERWLALMKETMMIRYSDEEMQLSIGCTDTLNSCIFNGLYRKIFNNSDMNLHLNISTHYSHALYELLVNRVIDVGFVYHFLHFKNVTVEPILKEKMYLVQEKEGAIRKNVVDLNELELDNEVAFMWETNYKVWHEQVVTKGRRNFLEVDTYSLLEGMLQDKGRWAIVPVTVANQLKNRIPVYVSELGVRKRPPERITYIIRNNDINKQKLETLSLFVDMVRNYFTEKGMDHFMDQYRVEG